jgi:hypothetical protein
MKSQKNFPQKNQLIYTTRVGNFFYPILLSFLSFCSDSKREVMYVKDEDKWEKDNDEKVKLRKAIKHIAHKNSKLIPEFRAKYPDCGKSDSKYSDQYNKLVIEALGGSGNEDTDNENKIIKKIAKEVTIDK